MELSASSAQRDASAAQRLDRNLLFQIFDYLRDGLAFLQCEATCTDYRSLLREESGIGQKLWQARPIAYGARLFATGGTAYAEDEEAHLHEPGQLEPYWVPGTVGWAERFSREICDGGREVVLGFACMDAIGAAQRLHGAIIAPLAGEQWTPLLNRLHRWENLSCQRPLDFFSSAVIIAATESVEAWIIDLMEKAWLCAIHRGSRTVTDADIRLAGRVSEDWTIRGVEFSGSDVNRTKAIDGIRMDYCMYFTGCGDNSDCKPLVELLAELDVATQERIIRKLARRAGFAAYNSSAYETLWRLLLLRLCVLLERVDEVYFSTMPEEKKICFPTYESWERSKHRPSLETLARVLQNGSGPIDPPPPRNPSVNHSSWYSCSCSR